MSIKSLFASCLFGLAVMFTAACVTDEEGQGEGKIPAPTPEKSVAAQFCERGDECNLLTGSSVPECTADVQAILDDASPSDRAEIEFDLETCLARPTCSGFAQCLGL